MRVTRVTAWIIQYNNDDIKCVAKGPDDMGKYSGLIEWWKNGRIKTPLISSPYMYDTEQSAINAMKEVVKKIREDS